MERPQKLELKKSNYIRIKVYLYLMTPDCEEVSEIEDSNIHKSAKNDPDAIISALSVEFENINFNTPVRDMQRLVMKEMQDSIYEDDKLRQIVSYVDQNKIINNKPEGVPKTEPIQVAEYIMTDEKDGMLGIINYDEIENILI